MYYWKPFVQQHGLETYWVSGNEEITGYVRVESEQGLVQAREAVATDERSCEAILHHLHEVAKSNAAEAVVFHCPHSGTLGQYLRGFGSAQYAPDAQRETNLQMIVLDLPSCLRAMQPELSRRARKSEFCDVSARYNIITESASVGIELRGGEAVIGETTADGEKICVPDRQMAQFLAGFRSPQASGHRVLDVLFPPGDPYWYVDDISHRESNKPDAPDGL